jgi:hypothetical protein
MLGEDYERLCARQAERQLKPLSQVTAARLGHDAIDRVRPRQRARRWSARGALAPRSRLRRVPAGPERRALLASLAKG